MSELRFDPLQRRWVIIATERARRPHDFKAHRDDSAVLDRCPFCPGNEDQTPLEIMTLREPGSAADTWRVRVANNKYPALSPEGEVAGELIEGLYRRLSGIGAHEVVIETPYHDQRLPDLEPDHAADLFRVYQTRLRELQSDSRLKYVLIFKNHGSPAGASLVHPHSQIIATPITPRTVQIELVTAKGHYDRFGRCLVCDMIRQEIDTKRRMIYNDGTVAAFNTYAARFPFELFIAPIDHYARYEHTPDVVIKSVSACIQSVLGRLRDLLDDPPYNYILHSAPNVEAPPMLPGYWETLEIDYHWHIEVIPRLTLTAGFEWGSGLHINPMPPEQAAQFLNDVKR